MVTVNIKGDNEKRVLFALEELKKSVHHDVIGYHFKENILLFSVGIDAPEIDRNIEKKKRVLNTAVSKFSLGTDHSIDAFKKAVEETVEERRRQPAQSFSILFFLNADRRIFGNRKHFTIAGNRLHLRTPQYVHKHFEMKNFIDQARYVSELSIKFPISWHTFQCFEIKSTGINAAEAFEDAFEIFELFRAVLNFSNNFNSFTQQFGKRSHLNSFLISPVYPIFNGQGKYLSFRYEVGKYEYKAARHKSSFQHKLFMKLLKFFSVVPKERSIEELLWEAFIKYGQALDSIDWETNFLKMWRIFELVTFYSEESSIKSTASRIKLLFGQKEFTDYSIDAVANLRNLLVHKGIFPEEGLTQLCILKILVENALLILFDFSVHFKDRGDLTIFYESGSAPTSDLKKRTRIIRKIIGWREKRKP